METVSLPPTTTLKQSWLIVTLGLVILSLFAAAAWYFWPGKIDQFISPLPSLTHQEKPLAKYSFETLRQRAYPSSDIKLEEVITQEKGFTAHLFSYQSDSKRITGQANIPTSAPPAGGFPVIIMLRGFVEKEVYQTGIGTRKAAAVFAQHGFLTLAPDFLGYAGSDPESQDILQARFDRPVTVLNLLASICQLPQANCQKIFFWGHSNGGQIALTVLAVTGQPIPTTLWAPVSKPFPYSILYYSDDLPDRGKYLRRQVADFERDYSADDYSVHAHYDLITAPLQIHQGTVDDAVPKAWSDQLVEDLKQSLTDITYHVYTGADHNLTPGWDSVVQRDLNFFREYLNQ